MVSELSPRERFHCAAPGGTNNLEVLAADPGPDSRNPRPPSEAHG